MPYMIVVIICGGQGTRLWPISKPEYPKHLLRLIDENSLLQNTIKRAECLSSNIYLVTEASHANEVKAQLPHIPDDHVIIEPARRGTASCIALALATIKQHVTADETVVFLHADHHIADADSFCKTATVAAQAAEQGGAITLIGLTPHYPATGFGYIKMGKELHSINNTPVFSVEKFVEKPDEVTARKYLKSNQYLWNLGLFAAPISIYEKAFAAHNKELNASYRSLIDCIDESNKAERCYLEFANEPIDTALIEKLDRVQVVPGNFDWADIGSFRDLHEILRDDNSVVMRGKAVQIDCEDTLIISETEQPVVAIGLEGFIVVNTDNGMLICPKDRAQNVKDGVEALKKLTD